MVQSSDKMWSAGVGNGNPLQYSCLENPMNSMKRQKNIYIYTYIYLYIYKTLKDELSRLVGSQHATGQEWRNNSIMNKEAENKQKQQLWM